MSAGAPASRLQLGLRFGLLLSCGLGRRGRGGRVADEHSAEVPRGQRRPVKVRCLQLVVVDADENAMTVFAAVRQDMRVRSSSPPSSPQMVTNPPSDDDTTR